MNAMEMIMKRTTIAKTFAIATVTALALGIAPSAKADDKGCSNLSLKGTFAHTTTGFLVAPAPVGAFAQAGTQTFDGRGGTSTVGMLSINGDIEPDSSTGTYTVNPDCTGTFILVAANGITAHYYFALSDNGAEFHAVCTDPVGIITRVGRRQFPLGDWRG